MACRGSTMWRLTTPSITAGQRYRRFISISDFVLLFQSFKKKKYMLMQAYGFLISLLPLRTLLVALSFSPKRSFCFSIADQVTETTSFQVGKLCVDKNPRCRGGDLVLNSVGMSQLRVAVSPNAICPCCLHSGHTGMLLIHCLLSRSDLVVFRAQPLFICLLVNNLHAAYRT